MSIPTDIEKENLESHVELCALRYSELERRLGNIEDKVGKLAELVATSQNSMTKVMIGTAGTVVAGVISVVLALVMKG